MSNVWKNWGCSTITFETGNTIAKCPKCEMEVATPRETWKMAGRPGKKGKRTELTIGLFDHCGNACILAKKKTYSKRSLHPILF